MLSALEIENFRSFQRLTIPRLGMVNLIVGKNNAGKSTVLEAVRILAGNGNRYLLDEIAESHDEMVRSRNFDRFAAQPTLFETQTARPYEDFFFGRSFPTIDGVKIRIGDPDNSDNLISIEHAFMETIKEVSVGDEGSNETITRRRVVPKSFLNDAPENLGQVIIVTRGQKSILTALDNSPRSLSSGNSYDDGKCGVVPTTFISMNDLARDWDKIALTEYEAIVKDAVRHIVPELEGITFVESTGRSSSNRIALNRVARVKLANERRPVPLSSLGDGMLRVFQMTLRAFSAKDGYLLIDEFENGLHYTIQEEIWATIFQLSATLNMQVFATTHSWDCIKSFATVCQREPQTEGVLFRIGRSIMHSNAGQAIATVFDKERLESITQVELEVR